jgi:hypothetical protein
MLGLFVALTASAGLAVGVVAGVWLRNWDDFKPQNESARR